MRKLFFLAIILGVTLGAAWVANNAGSFSLNWLGHEIEGSVAFLLIALFVAACLVWLILHFLYILLHLPEDLKRKRHQLKQDRGLQQLTLAMIASSENQDRQAKTHLEKARNMLPDSPLPRLMQLQLAGKVGDPKLAHRQFSQLQNYDKTKPLALRGLVEEARSRGDMAQALEYCEQLIKEQPRNGIAQKLAIDLYSYHGRWQEAQGLLKNSYAQRHIDKDRFNHLNAVIFTQQAVKLQNEKNRQSAMAMLKKALGYEAAFSPAAIRYTQLLKQLGKNNDAAKLLKKAWKLSPHPDIAREYMALFSSLPAEKRLKKAYELSKQNPKAIQTQSMLAEAAMDAGEWQEAKNYLKTGLSHQVTVKLCRQMVKLNKQGLRDEAEEKRWLEKAVDAVADALWQCVSCKAKPASWEAHCSQCKQFGTINWQQENYVAIQQLD